MAHAVGHIVCICPANVVAQVLIAFLVGLLCNEHLLLESMTA